MDQFLKKHKLLQLTQYEITNLNSSITNNIKFVIKKLSPSKISRSRWFHSGILPNITELIPTIYNLFQKMEEKGPYSNSFYEASITLIPKPDKGSTKKKFTNIPHNYRANTFNYILANRIQHYMKGMIHLYQIGFTPGMQGCFNIWKSINIIHQIKRLKKKITWSYQLI